MIKVNDKMPSGVLQHLHSDGMAEHKTDELFANKKVVMFAVPGAFTPTCSDSHLPGYVVNADKFKEAAPSAMDKAKAAAEKLAASQSRTEQLNDKVVTIVSKAGDEGKLFGSIGVRDIADAITAAGVKVAKSEVRLPVVSLRTVGEFDITVQLHSEIKAIIKLVVVAE